MSASGTVTVPRTWSTSTSAYLILRFSPMRYDSLFLSKCAARSASVAVTWLRNASALTGTTSSLTFSLRRRYSSATSLSVTAIQPLTPVRSFSIISARRRLSSNSVTVNGGLLNCSTWR